MTCVQWAFSKQLLSLVCQHVCVDCKKNYCNGCSAQLESRPLLCHTCQHFYGNLLLRPELMKLKVRELRDYLHLHGISTQLCREKVLFNQVMYYRLTLKPALQLLFYFCEGGTGRAGSLSAGFTVWFCCWHSNSWQPWWDYHTAWPQLSHH